MSVRLIFNVESNLIHVDPPDTRCLIPKARREGQEGVDRITPHEAREAMIDGAVFCEWCFPDDDD